MNYECLICQIKAVPIRLQKYKIAETQRNKIVGEILHDISAIDLKKSYSPEITRNILSKMQSFSEITDPYKKEKEQSNKEMLARYPEFQRMVTGSLDSFNMALRLTIAGNIIDFGPSHNFDVEETIQKVLNNNFTIDHSKQLRAAIKSAKTILYLGDNCGEIVLDKLFLETIAHPNVYFAVREKPVLNDATQQEALDVGIHKVATIISNGDDTPSTLLHRVSPDFRAIYNDADLILSKGMGNYEGLMYESDPRIFFMMMVKCSIIGKSMGIEKGDFVVKQNGRN